jgi:uncharacterized protein
MPVALSYPGVYVEEIPSGVRTITGVATSIALFIGWAARGPIDRAERITTFADYERVFGGLDVRTLLGHSVKQFFDNGGRDAYVIRVPHADAEAAIGNSGSLAVIASSPGSWANDYAARIILRPAPDAARFRIDVLRHQETGDAVVESFENLSMDDADARYAQSVVNGRSRFIILQVTDAEPPPAPPATDTVIELDGGADGPVLDPNSTNTTLQNAFHAAVLGSFGLGSITDRIDLFNIVCVPGESDPTTIAALQGHCRSHRAFLIVDSRADDDRTTVDDNFAAITLSDAPNSAIYFPWVRAADPLHQGAISSFPPCGFVAGVFARTDGARGVWKAPAGTEASVNGALGLVVPMSDDENGQLNPLGINCLRTLPVYGNVVWGARTLHGQSDRGSEWKYIPVRRMALFLEESLYRGTQWVVFEPNDEPLWAQIRLNIGAFMQNLFRQGAFQGKTPREAYFVKCDRETTTQTDINNGMVNIVVGFAPLKPAEFVVIKLQQIAGDIPT